MILNQDLPVILALNLKIQVNPVVNQVASLQRLGQTVIFKGAKDLWDSLTKGGKGGSLEDALKGGLDAPKLGVIG